MEIYIKNLTGKIIVIQVEDRHVSLLDMKKKVQEKVGIPPGEQCLMFRGRIIHGPSAKDHSTLADCNIDKEDTIDLILELRGGKDEDEKKNVTELYESGPTRHYRVAVSHRPEGDPQWYPKGLSGLWYASVDAPVLQTHLGGFGNAFYGVRLQVQVAFPARESRRNVIPAPTTNLSPEFKAFLIRRGTSGVPLSEAPAPQGDKTAERELAVGPGDAPMTAPRVLEELEHARLGAEIEDQWMDDLIAAVTGMGSAFTPTQGALRQATTRGRKSAAVDLIHHTEHDKPPPFESHNETPEFIEALMTIRTGRPGWRSVIYVKTLDGKTTEVPVAWDFTIGDIKYLVADKIEARPDDQLLVFAGKKLEDHQTLASYNVSRDSTLHCLVRKFSCRGCNFLGLGQGWNFGIKDQVGGILTQGLHRHIWGLGVPDAERSFCPACRYEALAELAALFPPLAHKQQAPIDPEALQWYLRCASPSPSTIWTPETDKFWPLVFRKVVRYCLQIRIPTAEGHGALTMIPHDVVSVIGSYL